MSRTAWGRRGSSQRHFGFRENNLDSTFVEGPKGEGRELQTQTEFRLSVAFFRRRRETTAAKFFGVCKLELFPETRFTNKVLTVAY